MHTLAKGNHSNVPLSIRLLWRVTLSKGALYKIMGLAQRATLRDRTGFS
ncbi:hypothetical protein [Moorena sp. SIO3B2]|nr:hypothetical protein [Moorena sp. SIO3B2]NEP35184.1 hypothetical protein [Moorena sp. SIO3B2]